MSFADSINRGNRFSDIHSALSEFAAAETFVGATPTAIGAGIAVGSAMVAGGLAGAQVGQTDE